ncbi:MAG: S1C family serine protease [Steroidobacteraceae bacterium]|jgi:serine protease DegS
MSGWQKAVIFIWGSIIGGMAFAFLGLIAAAQWRPELLSSLGLGKAPQAATEIVLPGAPSSAPSADGKTVEDTPKDIILPPAPVAGPSSTGSHAAAIRIAAPAVVNIYVRRVVNERVPRNFLQDPFGDFAPLYRRRMQQSLGSGVIIDPSGQIVTNHHVIDDAASIRVQLADGRVADAQVIGRDPDTDLALLEIDLPNLPAIRLGRSDQLAVGDVVLAIGNPIGLSQTVTQGIVSAVGRDQLGLATFENFIQTDAPINFGNSGGALINTRGELIGINTAVIARNLGVEGIGFAIPVNLVRGVVSEILSRGRVLRGWIGIAADTLTDVDRERLGIDKGGVLITSLASNGPAQRAGLRPGDVVVKFNDKVASTAREVLIGVADTSPGQTVTLEVLRGGQRGQARVSVEESPQQVLPRR